jgi:serine protease Do
MLDLRLPRVLRCFRGKFLLVTAAVAALGVGQSALGEEGGSTSSRRLTPIVRAVRGAAPAVVNIQGQKAAAGEALGGASPRQVNGMGTGVVIDARGYVLTNFHVVEGVRQINVTLADGEHYVAQPVAHDRETDLAVIRIRAPQALPVIRFGTSSDLMTGETVVALGNAFGYENTVTTGIISALHRNVQVNETQQYLDLIQTDASINPGNSGGPLMNIEGEMIGVNVAVRAGAQGIGFAIPVDKALDVAARLVSIERVDRTWHGMRSTASGSRLGEVTIAEVASGSPALASGLCAGDTLRRIGSTAIERPLDVERALLGMRAGQRVPVEVLRDGRPWETELSVAELASMPLPKQRDEVSLSGLDQQTWEAFGMLLAPEPAATFRQRGMSFGGGMRVTRVRAGSSASEQGVVAGDLLVKIHRWYTTSEQDLRYILSRADTLSQLGQVRFDIIRGQDRFFGHLALTPEAMTLR